MNLHKKHNYTVGHMIPEFLCHSVIREVYEYLLKDKYSPMEVI